jgi:type II secretory pathway predicted ATPase ExeA
MYKTFFGLRENPFNVNPDPRFLYLSSQTREAMDQLTNGIQTRKSFILLTGEVGTGKTTLINYLLDWLRHRKMPTAFIFNSHLSVNHLFDFILTDFGIPIDFQLKSNMLLLLNKWLIERFRAGQTPVLIVDEAQGLSPALLEEIRLLLNLETASEKLLQIVLVGQPELEDKLKRPELRQLRQRITLRCNTAPLTLEESRGYITERLRIGGATGDPIFASDAMEAVHFYSRGIPRVINLLCEHALINAYVKRFNPVPARMVEEIARDFLLDESRAFTTRSSFGNHINSNLTVMQSIFAKELVRPFTTEEASLREPTHSTWPPALAAFAVEEPALTAENSSDTTVPECGEISASGENLNVSVSLNELIPTLPVDSIACPSDSGAQLIAEMKRNLAEVSRIPLLHLMRPRGENEPSSAVKGNQMSPSENRALTLETVNRVARDSRRTSIHTLLPSLKAWRTHWESGFLPAISSVAWSRVSPAVLRWIRQPIYPVQVLQRWIFDFKRDWIAMIDAIALPEIKRSFLRWLRQPIHSNLWRQAKASPFEARRDLHK